MAGAWSSPIARSHRFREADFPTYISITERFVVWDAIDTWYHGARICCGGHAFAGLARKELLAILQARCAELGRRRCVSSARSATWMNWRPPTCLIASDGVNGLTRATHTAAFGPRVEMGKAKYCWFGTDLVLDAFTFIFRENEHGFFQVHAYPFAGELSTFIVETDESTWRRAGLDAMTEAESIAYCERLFAAELRGHHLLGNRSLWVSFATLSCAAWHTGPGGVARRTPRTPRTSPSGRAPSSLWKMPSRWPTRWASMPIWSARSRNTNSLAARWWRLCSRLHVKVSTTSRRSRRHKHLPPLPFTFNLLTRSGRVCYDDLRLRDARFGALVDSSFATEARAAQTSVALPRLINPPPAHVPLTLAGRSLVNRVALAAERPARMTPLEDLAVLIASEPGLLLVGAASISPRASVYADDLALYLPEHEVSFASMVHLVHTAGPSVVGIMLNHAGRRGAVRPPSAREAPDRPLQGGDVASRRTFRAAVYPA